MNKTRCFYCGKYAKTQEVLHYGYKEYIHIDPKHNCFQKFITNVSGYMSTMMIGTQLIPRIR